MNRLISHPHGRIAVAPPRTRGRQPSGGFTLVELMVAITVGLVIILAVSTVFLNSSSSRRETELSAEVIETGRYAVDTLGRELSQAGFYGTLAIPTGATNAPCSVLVSEIASSLTLHAIAFNSAPATSTADPACMARKAGTDAIFIQRASTCFVGETDAGGASICEAESNRAAYLQVSECATEYAATPSVVAPGLSPLFTLQTKACDGTVVSKRKLIRRFYFVNAAGVLNAMDVTLDGAQTPVAIAENVDQLQFEYGVDSDGDGTADLFTPTPTTAQMPGVVGARFWLVARSNDPSRKLGGALVYNIGDFVGADAVRFPAGAGMPKRRLYSGFIPFMTPKARAES